jgi:NAD(P)-dependent dehydrogenase (short-subunit alcohol dehydrogenase family)
VSSSPEPVAGIGRATALRLERGGWTVYATVRKAEDGEELVAEAMGHGVRPLRLRRHRRRADRGA